jgi:hypothetical protein
MERVAKRTSVVPAIGTAEAVKNSNAVKEQNLSPAATSLENFAILGIRKILPLRCTRFRRQGAKGALNTKGEFTHAATNQHVPFQSGSDNEGALNFQNQRKGAERYSTALQRSRRGREAVQAVSEDEPRRKS